jgi:polyphosphate kinase
MISEALLEKARLHVRRWFARRMPRHMLFHDLEHTLAVARSAVALGRSMGLPAAQVALLEMAALFHDTGYALMYKGHEGKSMELAEAFLKKHKVSKKDIEQVKDLIAVTELTRRPVSRLQKIMRDADSAKAGQADFDEKSELLRRELGAVKGKRPGGKAWLQENIDYLKHHRFHTAQGRHRYQVQKDINLKSLEERAGTPEIHHPVASLVHERYFDRDLSWLSFNDRVLQEAKDPRVPLLERIKFLAIYSSNLDEFYRVRVASLRSLIKLKKFDRTALEVTPAKRVDLINKKALEQQQRFGTLYRNVLLPALEEHGIRVLGPERLNAAQKKFVRAHFRKKILPLLNTVLARPGNAPFIEDRKLYFACGIKPKGKSAGKERLILLNIPSTELGRFILLPSTDGDTDILFLDDAVRLGLPELFKGHRITGCHAIKLSRDAELYLDEEFAGNVKEKVKKSLKKRHTGVPSRFLYDSSMPPPTLRKLRELLDLKKPDVVPGGRYHNFNDLMQLPVTGHPELRDPEWPPLQHPDLAGRKDLFKVIAAKDVLLHYPYHDFGGFVRWLQQAALDPHVERISMTLYRVAHGSAVCAALVDALHNGKEVTVFVEVQARFDEDSNLYWGEALEKAGAKVLYSYEDLKVHCKLCLLERREAGKIERYAYLGTGNFNENSARIYSDLGLLTSSAPIASEVAAVFTHLADRKHIPVLKHLMMAPLDLRSGLDEAIDREIAQALKGGKASITLKVNSLEDHAMIRKLYDASMAGVRIRIIVRGICCLVPGIPGLSDNIEVRSIIDRYLEHARIFVFHNAGRPTVHLASADLMGRNLDRRIEVAFPILDRALQRQVLELLELQWKDRVKARLINVEQDNPYLQPASKEEALQAQAVTYALLRKRAAPGRTRAGGTSTARKNLRASQVNAKLGK